MYLAYSTAENDLYDVYEEVYSMAGNWVRMAVGLRLLPRIKDVIATKYSNKPEECLLAVVEEWLKGLHDVQKYGHPSWRVLVQAVAHPTGGANPKLAQSIAAKHSGNYHSYATKGSVVSLMLVPLVTFVCGEESDANGTVQTAHQAHSKRIVHDCMCVHTITEAVTLCRVCVVSHKMFCDYIYLHGMVCVYTLGSTRVCQV